MVCNTGPAAQVIWVGFGPVEQHRTKFCRMVDLFKECGRIIGSSIFELIMPEASRHNGFEASTALAELLVDLACSVTPPHVMGDGNGYEFAMPSCFKVFILMPVYAECDAQVCS